MSTSEPDLTGKLVLWQCEGQWLTARVTRAGEREGTWRGEVVDPGNYSGLSMFAPKQSLRSGDELPNLRDALCSVIEEEVSRG